MKSTISNRKVKRACVDCHFLTELEFHSVPDDLTVGPPFVNGFEIIYEELHPYKREQAKKKDYSQFKSLTRGPLRCYLECWEERGLRPDQKLDEVRHERIVETDRNDCCFFFEYKPTMSFEAAERMQERLAVLQVGKHKEEEKTAQFPTPPSISQKPKSVETTLSYDKTTGKFRFGKIESVAISKTSRTRVSNTAEKLMKWWAKGKPCPQSEIVKNPARKTPQGVHDDISKIRKALEPLGANMLQCTSDGYPPPQEPKNFNIASKKLD